MCCTWFAHDWARVAWAYMLATVRGAVRRLQKISNCAFECDYHYYKHSSNSFVRPAPRFSPTKQIYVPTTERLLLTAFQNLGLVSFSMFLFCFALICFFLSNIRLHHPLEPHSAYALHAGVKHLGHEIWSTKALMCTENKVCRIQTAWLDPPLRRIFLVEGIFPLELT